MRPVFYSKLALTGIKKNKRLYVPFMLAYIGMIMMFYIISSLSGSSVLGSMRGGRTAAEILSFGAYVIAIFSLIFLFYTNSFLIRRRNKEFGLYNILGMGKRNIAKIIGWETLIVSFAGIAGGLVLGISFSKLAELCMINILHMPIDYTLRISGRSVVLTLVFYVAIFFLMFCNSLLKVSRVNAINLLHSENFGEKAPKANWLIALIGFTILGFAYYLAVITKEPVAAIMIFFIAVIMVIIATYMIFISGSVTICRLLQKNKKYYYKKNHFVSVSSMIYRMKRNGAGLASICILITMILVMLSSTTSLYVGADTSIETRYPHDAAISVITENMEDLDNENIAKYREAISKVFLEHSVEPKNVYDYRFTMFSGYLIDGQIFTDNSSIIGMTSRSKLFIVNIVPLEDYNRTTGKSVALADGEALVACSDPDTSLETIRIGETKQYTVAENIPVFLQTFDPEASLTASLSIVVGDFYDYAESLESVVNTEYSVLRVWWSYGFDMDASDNEQIAIIDGLEAAVYNSDMVSDDTEYRYIITESKADNKADFYSAFGGLFFIGIMLSIVFISAAVLIIYYKQISEGYEDRSRFSIMQKVGMTDIDIKKNINSQVLTVFYMPLVFAGLHLGFAFPLIWTLLKLFNIVNLKPVLCVTICAYLIFAVIYGLIYRVTSRSYYKIVRSDIIE